MSLCRKIAATGIVVAVAVLAVGFKYRPWKRTTHGTRTSLHRHRPICTKEACSFREVYERFVDAGAKVIGVSGDTSKERQRFAKRNVSPFRLISDRDGALRKAFSVPNAFGFLPCRTSYVIEKERVARLVFTAQFATNRHIAKAMAAVC